ncbi:MAG TPA: hypothetical protein VJ783_02020 [Pirellulales bacterium]|nr:hypothetical protein [Pirellulales bacterium]
MSFDCKPRCSIAVLLMALQLALAGAAMADDDSPTTTSSASDDKAARAPEHRMNQALIGDRPALAPLVRPAVRPGGMLTRLDCGDVACPLCGRACPTEDDEAPNDDAGVSLLHKTPLFQRLIAREQARGEAPQPDGKRADGLRPGEPAQVILDLKRRLGDDVYGGTEFGGSPEAMIEWIRTLDEEDRRQLASPGAIETPGNIVVNSPPTDGASAIEIDALRQAARKLGEAADLLEEQNLFDSADEVRAAAEALRCRARERVHAAGPSTDSTRCQEAPPMETSSHRRLGCENSWQRPFNFFMGGQR